MSYRQISAALAIARGTVQGQAEHSRRVGLVPGLIFVFRDEDDHWYPAEPEVILPGGPTSSATASRPRLPAGRFAGGTRLRIRGHAIRVDHTISGQHTTYQGWSAAAQYSGSPRCHLGTASGRGKGQDTQERVNSLVAILPERD